MLEELYETLTVHKNIVIAKSDEDCILLKSRLHEIDVDTVCITMDHVHDDRPLYMRRLRSFAKALCITFDAWYNIRYDIEQYAMDHNILYMHDLDPQQMYMVFDWVNDCANRGLRTRAMSYYVATENFLMNMLEHDDKE